MIKAIAIDDEPPSLMVIEKFCIDSNKIDLQKTFNKPNEALKFIHNNKIDLLFLDINMPSISGIELYKSIEKNIPVIFTTAYSDYAVVGFELNAIDYLLKPFTYERFLTALNKFEKSVLQNSDSENKFLHVRADYALHKIELDKVLYFEGYDDYVKIHIIDQKTIVARMTMKTIVEKIDTSKFARVHRSYIVALDKIQSIKSKSLFINNIEIPISSSYEGNIKL